MAAGRAREDQPEMQARVHPSATVEDGAVLGQDASVWHQAIVRTGARLGERSSVGSGAYIGSGVVVGSDCKIQNVAQIFEGATLGDGVFVGPGAILANDRYPRAVNPDGRRKEAADWQLDGVVVGHGASLGAGAIVCAGIRVGRWALVAAGATVTRDVPDFALVMGAPARLRGWVCRCAASIVPPGQCHTCGNAYHLEADLLVEVPGPAAAP